MNDLKDRIDEILADFKGRFRNPLVLSFLLVWAYYHWRLVYEIFTVDNGIAVGIRADHFETYIHQEGWSGMIGYPLFFSVVSLVSFYLIGAAAQFIKLWLGKRLPASILAKWDKGTYDLKTETDKYKEKARIFEEREKVANSEIESLKSKIEKDEIKDNELHSQLTREIRSLKENLEKGRQEYEKLEVEHKASNELLDTARQDASKLQGLLYDNDIKAIFPFGSRWEMKTYVNGSEKNSVFTVEENAFVFDDGKLAPISGFKMHRVEKWAYFKIANIYSGDSEVRLIIEKEGFLMGMINSEAAVQLVRIDGPMSA